MKKTLLATRLALALCATQGLAFTASAANFPVTPAQREQARQTAETGVDVSQLAPNAPESYTVKPGDTLWKISGMFLKAPWHWPALWGMNLSEIKNPHLIYPGEVLYLDIANGRARLTKQPSTTGEVRLSPSIRVDAQLTEAIPTIPFDAIRPFLTKPLMVDAVNFMESGVVVATQEDHLNVGSGGRIYATNLPATTKAGDRFTLYRSGRVITDPTTKERLGVEAVYLGEAKVTKVGGQSTLIVSAAVQEVGQGDRLLVAAEQPIFRFVPHAPSIVVEARVVTIHDGRSGGSLLSADDLGRGYETEGGPLSIVVLNRGEMHGLEPGHVLTLQRPARMTERRGTAGWLNGERVQASVEIPAEAYGNVMVFKTFSNISYGIVLQASEPVQVSDNAWTPEGTRP